MEYKILYNKLLKDGDLLDFMPEATGIWEEDRKEFIDIQDMLDYITETGSIFEDEED